MARDLALHARSYRFESGQTNKKMACSSMVGAGALYAQGYRFEPGQANR